MIVPDLIKAVESGWEKSRLEGLKIQGKHRMNERIKELANIWANRRAEDEKLGIVYTFSEPALEQFAQLIVGECMDIARNVGNISEPDDWALDRCYEIEQKIQDRFGVKE